MVMQAATTAGWKGFWPFSIHRDMKVSSGILFSMLHDEDSWIVGLLDEHRAWRSVCVACCGWWFGRW